MGLSGGIPIPSDPHLRRWMMFVDGENLTIRAQRLAQHKGIQLREGGITCETFWSGCPK
jgi:hypothetical protein